MKMKHPLIASLSKQNSYVSDYGELPKIKHRLFSNKQMDDV